MREKKDVCIRDSRIVYSRAVLNSEALTRENFFTVCLAAKDCLVIYIEITKKELVDILVLKNEMENFNAAQAYRSSKTIKELHRVKKRLEYQLTHLEELSDKYRYQKRYRDGADNLKSAMSITSAVSRRASIGDVTNSLALYTQKLFEIEQSVQDNCLGVLRLQMKGLLGYARLKSGDQYELMVRHGAQKWRSKGLVKSSALDQTWEGSEAMMRPLVSEHFYVKVEEVRMFGKRSLVGVVSVEVKDLFKVGNFELQLDLNEAATLKIKLGVQWSPFEGYRSSDKPPSAIDVAPSTVARADRSCTITTPACLYSTETIVNDQQQLSGAKLVMNVDRLVSKLRPLRMTANQPAKLRPTSSFFT